ncbi:hypothetical protein D1872_336210 [compost metagenome]
MPLVDNSSHKLGEPPSHLSREEERSPHLFLCQEVKNPREAIPHSPGARQVGGTVMLDVKRY